MQEPLTTNLLPFDDIVPPLPADLETKEEGKHTSPYILAAVIGFGGYFVGYNVSIMNPLGRPLAEVLYRLDQREQDNFVGNTNFFFLIGVLIATLSSGTLADRVGRIKMVIGAEIVATLVFCMYWFDGVLLFYAVRFVAGMAAGFTIYIGQITLREFLPQKYSGFGGILYYISGTGFILISFSQSVIFGGREGLVKNRHIVLGWPIVISLFRLSGLLKFFLGRMTPQCIINRREIVGESSTTEQLLLAYTSTHGVEFANEYVPKLMAKPIIKHSLVESLKSMFTDHMRPRLYITLFINIFQQLSGINFLIFFSTTLFDRLSGNGQLVTVLLGVANISGGFIAMQTLGTLGRRFNLQIGSFVQSITMTIFGIGVVFGYSLISAISAIVYICAFGMGLGGTLTLYTAEISNPIIVSVTSAIQWLVAAIIGRVVPNLMSM